MSLMPFKSSSSRPPKDCWIRWARAKSPMPIFADRRLSTTLVSPTNRPINPSGNREAASDERIACGFVFFRFLHRIVCRSGPSKEKNASRQGESSVRSSFQKPAGRRPVGFFSPWCPLCRLRPFVLEGNPTPFHQLLNLPAQKTKRRNNEQQVLHPRGVVIGLNHFVGYERPMPHIFGERERNLPGR